MHYCLISVAHGGLHQSYKHVITYEDLGVVRICEFSFHKTNCVWCIIFLLESFREVAAKQLCYFPLSVCFVIKENKHIS